MVSITMGEEARMNMKKMITAALMIVPTIYLSHSSSQKEAPGQVILVKEKTNKLDIQFTLENSVPITGISYPSMFFYKNILHVDGFGSKDTGGPQMVVVHRFTKNLETLDKKYIPIGQGPGDLGGGPRFSGGGEFIYVSDNTQRRISVFTKDLEFVKMVTVKRYIFSAEFNDDGTWFLCSMGRSEDTKKGWAFTRDCCLVTFPGLSINVFEKHGPYYPIDSATKKLVVGSQAGYHFFRRNGSIYYINMDTYEIGKYDTKGNCLKKIRVQVDKVKVPDSKRLEWLKTQSGSLRLNRKVLTDTVQPASWMVPLGKGLVVVRRYSYDTDCEGMVEGDYFSYDLEMMGKVKIPCFWFIFKLRNDFHAKSFKYRDGYLYLLRETEDDFRLEKWLVKE
jgi:hypothetical protein